LGLGAAKLHQADRARLQPAVGRFDHELVVHEAAESGPLKRVSRRLPAEG
jgi:hypothetical protein